jgi:hypothetical protein
MISRRELLCRAAAVAGARSARGAARRPFILSATVDFPDDVGFGVYTPDLLEKLVTTLRGLGVRRIYWLYYGDVDPASECAGTMIQYMKFGRATLERIGEPVKAAVPVAHRHGMELYAVLKPYNTGIAGTYPAGSPESGATRLRRIGGTIQQAIPFIERHPEMRIRRRPETGPAGLESTPVRRIRLVKQDDSPTRVRKENLQLWASSDNYRYRRLDVPFSLRESVEPAPREVRDYYGDRVTARGAPVRVLTLENLALTDRFVAVTTDLPGPRGDFRNTALAMIEVFGDGPEPLPIVVATLSAIWTTPRSFRDGGLEFDSGYGPFLVELDVNNEPARGVEWSRAQGGCIAFSRGKNEYLAVAPCEVYPEVQRLWLGWVDRLLAAGVDGIDLRVSAHGTLTDEPHAYGWNEPVAAEYRRLHGADQSHDTALLSELRGAHYTGFVREASRRVRARGKRMQVHVHTEAFRANPCHGQLMGFPANVRFEWQRWLRERLVDGITLRTSWFEGMEDPFSARAQRSRMPGVLEDPVVVEALALSAELRIPAYLNRYISRAVGLDEYIADIDRIFHDSRFAGFDIYEFVHLARPNARGELEAVGERLERLRAKGRELGLV